MLVNVVADPVIMEHWLRIRSALAALRVLPEVHTRGTGTLRTSGSWDGTAIGGATASTYLPPSYDTPGTYTYYAEVTSRAAAEVAQSEEAEVVVVATQFSLQPSDTSYCQLLLL